jgi:hypothetical protein
MTISGLECLLEHYHDDVVDLPDRERGGVEDGRKKAGTCTCQKRGRCGEGLSSFLCTAKTSPST